MSDAPQHDRLSRFLEHARTVIDLRLAEHNEALRVLRSKDRKNNEDYKAVSYTQGAIDAIKQMRFDLNQSLRVVADEAER